MVALLTREVLRVPLHTVMLREFPHYAVQNMLRAMLPPPCMILLPSEKHAEQIQSQSKRLHYRSV